MIREMFHVKQMLNKTEFEDSCSKNNIKLSKREKSILKMFLFVEGAYFGNANRIKRTRKK